MTGVLNTLEHNAFSQWVTNSPSAWAFPTLLFLHTTGMSIVAGGSAIIDLVLLGSWPTLPVKPLERLYPVIWVGFWMNAITGTVMLCADATAKLSSLDFYLKMIFVFAGVYVLHAMRKTVFADPQLDKGPVPRSAKLWAWASLFCWFAAITAGRLLAYVGPNKGAIGG
jgi:hypothetical protein